MILAFRKHAMPTRERLNVILEKEKNSRRTRDLLLPRLRSGQVVLDSVPAT
jgi:hypothetical protein